MSESKAEAAAAVAAAAGSAGNWRRAGIVGTAIGVVAAGAAAGVAIERLTVGRGMRQKARLALDSTGPYGALRGMPGTATADDGTEIYYEIDDVEQDATLTPAAADCSAARPRPPSPSSSATVTASARTPGTSSGPPCAESYAPSTGTSAATAAPDAVSHRSRTVCRSTSSSSAAI